MRIAVADDDIEMRDFLSDALQRAGYRVLAFASGRELMIALQRDTFDLIMVDWNMPEPDGIAIVRWVGDNLKPAPPVVMVTSRSDKDDIVEGLEAGADDFIVKPEAENVILARVAAVLRRRASRAVETRQNSYGKYTLDNTRLSASFDGEDVTLTAREFALARLFFENLDKPLSRRYILDTIFKNAADVQTRTLDVHVSRLRIKLALRADNGFGIRSEFGFGYRMTTFGE